MSINFGWHWLMQRVYVFGKLHNKLGWQQLEEDPSYTYTWPTLVTSKKYVFYIWYPHFVSSLMTFTYHCWKQFAPVCVGDSMVSLKSYLLIWIFQYSVSCFNQALKFSKKNAPFSNRKSKSTILSTAILCTLQVVEY